MGTLNRRKAFLFIVLPNGLRSAFAESILHNVRHHHVAPNGDVRVVLILQRTSRRPAFRGLAYQDERDGRVASVQIAQLFWGYSQRGDRIDRHHIVGL